jgi:hypothetical protein
MTISTSLPAAPSRPSHHFSVKKWRGVTRRCLSMLSWWHPLQPSPGHTARVFERKGTRSRARVWNICSKRIAQFLRCLDKGWQGFSFTSSLEPILGTAKHG